MDVVAHAGAVGGGEVVAVDDESFALAYRDLDRRLHQVGGADAGGTGAAVGVRAGDIEVAQRAIVEVRVRHGDIGQHPLGHEL